MASGELLLAAVVLAVGVLGLRSAGGDLQVFVGRFHPLIVHLPIGVLLLAGIVEALSRTRRFAGAGLERLLLVIVGIGALTTIAAILTGLLLSSSGEYDAALVARHQQWGLLLGLTALLATVGAWWRIGAAARAPHTLYAASLVGALVLVTVTGHYGGSLTHGETYLTEHLPFRARQDDAARGAVDLSTTKVFATLVAPTIEARCVGCHGPARQSGKLRLDSPEAIRKGGESGAAVTPGSAAGSLIVRRIFLPTSDAKVMPPKGHPTPSHADVALLRWWIDQGASFDQVLADATVTPDVEPAIAARLGPVDFAAPAILSVRVQPGDPKAIAAARALKLRVEPLRDDSSLLVIKAPPAARGFDDAALKTLEPLATQIAWLDLGGTQVTDAGLSVLLPRLVNLWRLSLDRTAITDRALLPLEKLPRLETVNVYATQVTDAGLKPLEKLPRLRAVYAWQTQVTSAGAESLKAAARKVQVNVGAPPEPEPLMTAEGDGGKAGGGAVKKAAR